MPVLTIADAAKQLGCPKEDQVMRLVARGALKASSLPSGIRIVESDLEEYLQKGAPDFSPPPDEALLAYVQGFEQAIFKAAEPQFWTDAQVKQKAGSSPSGTLLASTLTFSPAIRGVVDGPVGKLISEIPGNTIRDRYPTWGSLYLAAMLRAKVDEAKKRAGTKFGNGLYSSREDYEAILVECFKLTITQQLATDQKAQPEPPAGPVYTIRYELPVAAFADDTRLTAAAALAF